MKDVPDEELLIGQDGLDGVEVDVHFVLTGDEVLRLAGVGRMDVAHPVGLAGVVAVDVVEEFVVVVHLRSRQKNMVPEDPLEKTRQAQGQRTEDTRQIPSSR